ncbi:MAG: SelB C-terminal domain-containing protein, partial [bacterium]
PVIEMLARLDTQDHIARLQVHLDQASTFGAPMDQLAVRSGVLVDDVSNTLTELEKGGKAVLIGAGGGALAYSSQSYEELQKKLVKTLTAYHKGNPLKTGMGREELRMKLARDFPERPFKMLLAALEEMEEIELEKDTVRLKAHEATLTPQQEALSGKVMEILAKDGLSPPFVQDLAKELSARPDELKALLGLLAQRGDVVRIKDDYFIHPDEHESLMKKVLDYFGENSEMAMANFREITGITRKWMIPLLEYMDRTQVTMRRGDVRIKRGS